MFGEAEKGLPLIDQKRLKLEEKSIKLMSKNAKLNNKRTSPLRNALALNQIVGALVELRLRSFVSWWELCRLSANN